MFNIIPHNVNSRGVCDAGNACQFLQSMRIRVRQFKHKPSIQPVDRNISKYVLDICCQFILEKGAVLPFQCQLCMVDEYMHRYYYVML